MNKTVEFVVDFTDQESGLKFNGVFKAKAYLSNRETLKQDEIRRNVLGVNSVEASEYEAGMAGAIAYLAVRLTDSPEWWRKTNNGLDTEVAGLLAKGCGRDLKAMRAIGYKEAAACLAGECSPEEAEQLIKRDTRRYAKRQLTWFNADKNIIWLEYPEKFATILKHAIDFFDRREA